MAIIYVDSSTGSDADSGATWSLAKATLDGADAIDAAGDTIYLSQNHVGNYTAAVTIALAGTLGSPTKIICANDAAEPPTTLATATEQTTGAFTYILSGSCYCYGITINAGIGSTGTSSINLQNSSGNESVYESCNFILSSTSGLQRILIGSSTDNIFVKFINSFIKFSSTNQGLNVNGDKFTWVGGGIAAGGSAITTLFATLPQSATTIIMDDIDLSQAATALNLFTSAPTITIQLTMRDCKMPASWSGGFTASPPTALGSRFSMYNCGVPDRIETPSGKINAETVIVKTTGMTDGTTPTSWKMVTNSTANEVLNYLVSDWYSIYNTSTGASKTLTCEIIHDSVTALTDEEIWVEVEYLATSGSSLGALINDHRVILATAANQTTSSVSWTTTGLTNPNKQKLEVTFTPQAAGFIRARAYLAKVSYTVYVGEFVIA